MMRWKPARIEYTEPVLLLRFRDGTASGRGTDRTGTKYARVLRASSEASETSVPYPTVSPPSSNTAPPGLYGNWQAWWPSPPSETRSGSYTIPDPPKSERPVLPTADAQVLWESYGVVGANAWTGKRVSGVFVRGEWKDITGSERITGMQDVQLNTARLLVNPAIFQVHRIDPKNWLVRRVDDLTEWDIKAMIRSHRRGRFLELMLESRGNQ